MADKNENAYRDKYKYRYIQLEEEIRMITQMLSQMCEEFERYMEKALGISPFLYIHAIYLCLYTLYIFNLLKVSPYVHKQLI